MIISLLIVGRPFQVERNVHKLAQTGRVLSVHNLVENHLKHSVLHKLQETFLQLAN